MGHRIELTAADGHRLDAWLVEPAGDPTGGLVVIQEIFGVNAHIRDVCERFAAAGFLTVAPAPFDRIDRNIAVEYTDISRGRDLIGRLEPRQSMLDFAAATEYATRAGRVGVVGFCWGGAQAYRCAAELPMAAAVGYYGGGIDRLTGVSPACPLMLHYGAEDAHIPAEQVEAVRMANPDAVIHVYAGVGHGFNCDQRPDYDADAAALAFRRTISFLQEHLGD